MRPFQLNSTTARIFSYTRTIRHRQGYRKAAGFFPRALLHQKISARWFDYLERDLPPDIPDSLKIHLAQRIYRPYLRAWLAITDRVDILVCHYSVLQKYFAAPARLPVWEAAGIKLAVLTGKDGAAYDMILRQGTSKEGEMVFSLVGQGPGLVLASLTAVIGPGSQGLIFWIGGLQGAKPPAGRTEIVQATRNLNGLRPKQAVLHAACAFAGWLGVEKIVAPARQNHISQRGWRKWRLKRRIRADYDDFWAEFSPIIQDNGDYQLPVRPPARPIEDVKSRKRKEWQRRHERLDALKSDVCQTLDRLRAPSGT